MTACGLTNRMGWRPPLQSLALALSLLWSVPAVAQDQSLLRQIKEISAQLKAQEARLAAQERLLKVQEKAIAQQAALIKAQRSMFEKAKPVPVVIIDATRRQPSAQGAKVQTVALTTVSPKPRPNVPADAAAQTAPLLPSQPQFVQTAQVQTTVTTPAAATPDSPVGEAPVPDQQPPQVVQSLPEALAVLTPASRFVVTPSLEYTHTNNNRLVFRGVVIVPGVNLGEVDASSDDRNIVSNVWDLRYGINGRIEVEARVPFLFSDDRATVLSQGPGGSATQSIYFKNSGIGDAEFSARYQINAGLEAWPIFVANARVKTDTGLGPFDVKRDSAGVAEQVALGSGFVALGGGISMVKLTDPAVLFASLNYVYEMPKDINQTIGNVLVGRVDPGSSVSANLGFGFSVNPDFSFSLGYQHSYVFPQSTILGGTRQSTNALQVGALTFGMAYRLGPTMSLNGNFEIGVTADAPDVRAVFSVPTSF